MIEPGEITDKYMVEALVGEGGIARVYRVRHTTLGSAHALKLLAVRGGAIHRRLVREGRIQATLDHPHVVSVTDVIEHNGHPGLVMEYIEGHSLDRVLASTGSLSIPVALSLSAQIFGAISAAHARSVLHRDLKPANVMLEPTTGGVRAMVTDFGIARLMADTNGDTLQGDFLGTPGYMAPEQVSDPTAVDVRADIYSLGALVYCMVCGRPPFLPSASLVDTLRAASAADFPSVLSLRPDCPPNVASTIEAALAADPSGRPATVEAFGERLFAAAPELMQVVGGQAGVADLELPGFRTGAASDALAPITGTPLTGRPNQTVVPDTYDAGPQTIASMLDAEDDGESAPNLAALLANAAAATAAVDSTSPISEDSPSAPPATTAEGAPPTEAPKTEAPATTSAGPQPVPAADDAPSPNTLDAVQAVRGPSRWPWAVAGLVLLGLGAIALQPDSPQAPPAVPASVVESAPTAAAASPPSTASNSIPVPPVPPTPEEAAPEPVASKQTAPDTLPPPPTAEREPTAPSPSSSPPPQPDPPSGEPAPTGSDTPPEAASPPPPTEAPEPPQTGSDAPPDDGASSPDVPAAAAESPDEAPPPEPETTPPPPAVPLVQGTWTGKSKGRALKLRIVSQSGARIVGELELAAGPENYKFFSVAGRIEPDGSFALAESAPGWRLEGKVSNDEVVGTMRHPDSRKPSPFSAARQ